MPPLMAGQTAVIPVAPDKFHAPVTSPQYEVRTPSQFAGSFANYTATSVPHPAGLQYQPHSQAPQSRPPQTESAPGVVTMGGYTDLTPHERPDYYAQQAQLHYAQPSHGQEPTQPAQLGPDQPRHYSTAGLDHVTPPSMDQMRHYSVGSVPQVHAQLGSSNNAPNSQYRYTPHSMSADSVPQRPQAKIPYHSQVTQPNYQYAPQLEKITYTTKPQTFQQPQQPLPHAQTPRTQQQDPLTYAQMPYPQKAMPGAFPPGASIIDVTPGAALAKSSQSAHRRLTVNGPQPSLHGPPSSGSVPRPDRLSVSGARPNLQAGAGLPPPSPLLEAYHGTYQSISPMVAPMMLPFDDLDALPSLSSLSMTKERRSASKSKHDKFERLDDSQHKGAIDASKERKRVKLYDAQEDALALVEALSHHKINNDAIIDILPSLSHDQMMELRNEYKKHCKIQGRGINVSKHIKLKLTGNFGKVAYVTALGRWESEGYWANFWYQSHGSRRELLIESLMGRTNSEIRMIKENFKDKRYSDDLVKCMEKELKADKFKTAVLMVLREERQDESDVYPLEYRNRDVDVLAQSLRSREGGESAMLEIIVRRSDSHLRDVLKTYERMYQENFARAALKKSNNLVGEVIAHILNGVINRPARDALLLRHAIDDIVSHNKDDELRYELLISRLVRLHWDRAHLLRVRREYAEKYGKELDRDVEDATKGDFREFLCEMCLLG
ncbi:hypothetical protein LTR50_003210 [Elasticomyces elasticus]|nr:hypothetical protein LTR50_003210 [Elasticomyces elasticus]